MTKIIADWKLWIDVAGQSCSWDLLLGSLNAIVTVEWPWAEKVKWTDGLARERP